MKFILPLLLLFSLSCNLLTSSSPPETRSDVGVDLVEDENTSDTTELASCSDSLKNGNETDLNCGGDCRPCTDNMSCRVADDCASSVCDQGICTPPRCDDGIANGTESDIDCGGLCDTCSDGSACVVLRDCLSNLCEASICVGICNSKCGGDCPQKCAVGDKCAVSADCDENLWCDGDVCDVIPEGWKRTVSFMSLTASVDFNAYVRLPDFVEGEGTPVFEKDGEILSSETAEEVGAFWVHLENVGLGENSFEVSIDKRKTPAEKMWSDQIGVFHSPGLIPVIASDLDVRESTNVQSVTGRFGTASFFDGAAYVKVTGNGVEALFPTFTISAWFRRAMISEEWKPLIGRQFSSTNSDDFALGDFRAGTLYACTQGTCAVTLNPIAEDTWFFVSMTYDGTTMKVYINGQLNNQSRGTRTQTNAGNPLTIGGDVDNAQGDVDKFFIGTIDEVRFSSGVKTAAAIELQYLSTEPLFFSFGDKQPLTE